MTWKGKELRSPGDFVGALRRLEGPDDARAFRAAWSEEHGDDLFERNVGWLTGDMGAADGDRVRKLLGIQHPLVGDLEPVTPRELLELGMAFMKAQIEGSDFDRACASARLAVRTLRATREMEGE